MTPALLPGFHPHVHGQTRQPCLVQSSNSSDYSQGMLLLGQGKAGKNLINQHYRCEAKRTKQQVECDVVMYIPRSERIRPESRWRLCRVKIRAYVWLWSNVDPAAGLHSRTPPWTIEDYIAGNFGPPMRRTILEDVSGDESSGSASDEYICDEQQVSEEIRVNC